MGQSCDMIRGLYEAFGRGDIPAVLEAMDDRIEWSEAENSVWADGNPYVGPDACLKGIFQRIGAELNNFAATPINIIDGGDTVAVEGRYTGTVKSTGNPVDAQFLHVWEIDNGKLTRFQQYTDTRQWSEAYES